MKIDNILFLDIETTGTDHKKNGIIQIAMEYHENGEKIASFNKKCIPSTTFTDLGALKYNGVKYSQLDKLGVSDKELLKDFLDFLLNLPKNKNIYLGGHNVNFDVNFINEWLSQNNIEGLRSILPYRVVDTSTLGMFLSDGGIFKVSGKFNFESMLSGLGLLSNSIVMAQKNIDGKDILHDLDERLHDAAYDVKMTAKAYYTMTELRNKLLKSNVG